MTYVSTDKYINTLRAERICEYCQKPVTSLRRDGLARAYRKHLQAHHPAIFHATGRKFRQYPANSTPPELPDEPKVRPSIECPYCKRVFTSSRANLLDNILKNHKRTEHVNEYADEVATKVECTLRAVEAEPLVSVRVAQCYYPKSSLSARYPAPKVVMVPARWNVESVFVHCDGAGRMLAYRGKLGASEAWRVG